MKRNGKNIVNSLINIESREISFDGGWSFFHGDPSGAEREKFDDSKWRKLRLPHDWSIEDLPDSDDVEIPCLSPVQGKWKLNFGDDPSWKDAGFVDIFWKDVDLPSVFSEYSVSQENIYAWLRRSIAVPDECRGRDIVLDMGVIADCDETYVNGELVGKTGDFPNKEFCHYALPNSPRFYKIPAKLTSTKNMTIAVRIFAKNAKGGIHSLNIPSETPLMRTGPFDFFKSEGGKHTGHFVGGIGWYRKSFTISGNENDKIVSIVFDGIYMDSDVWLNGRHIGTHHYGYTSFALNLTPYLKPEGQTNIIAVRVRNEGLNSRWYSGSGIYRHVKLMITEPIHVALWGVSVSTMEIKEKSADIKISVAIENQTAMDKKLKVAIRILSPSGACVAEMEKACLSTAGSKSKIPCGMEIPDPELWEPGNASMYCVDVTLLKDGKIIDKVSEKFGVRTVAVSAAKGFMLNGKTIKLKGGCVHHDNGLLGSVSVERAEVRRLEILKAAGYNAVRCSHNPPSSVFLDACDKLGILVIDEAFDHWLEAKTPMDYHRFFNKNWPTDLDAMLLRDFNHPSVVMWSIGNEIPSQYTPENYRTAWMLADHVRAIDSSRPVTQASWIIPDIEEKKFPYLDVIGYNYCLAKYERDFKDNPQGVYVASESYPRESFEYWQAVENTSALIGDFIWTAWDYFGESGCGNVNLNGRPDTRGEWPWHIANCGDFDICGFPKPQSFYRRVLWDASKVEMLVHQPLPAGVTEEVNRWGWRLEEPSWTWHGHEGRNMDVRVFSKGDRVDILLNGVKLDSKEAGKAHKYISEFSVPYEAGELKAEVFLADVKIAETVLKTAAAATHIGLSAEKSQMSNSSDDLVYVKIELLDPENILVPEARKVKFNVSGAGELAAAGNGNPLEVASMRKNCCNTWKGSCLVILRQLRTGDMILKASSDSLEDAELKITVL